MADSDNEDLSLSQLQRETERSRADLVQTVDALRTRVADTAEDLKSRVSPSAIKEEVKDYVRNTGQQWYETIERRAKENPLQAVAIAAGVAYPAFRLLKSIPAPLLLIGAGIALSRSGSSVHSSQNSSVSGGGDAGVIDRLQGHMEGVSASLTRRADQARDSTREALGEVSDRISGLADRTGSTVSDAGSSISNAVSGMSSTVQDVASNVASNVRETGANAGEQIGRAIDSVQQRGADAADYVADQVNYLAKEATHTVERAQQSFGDIVERNPLLIGGLGIALGAVIAASFPITRPENQVLGGASNQLKDQGRQLLTRGTEAAREIAQQTYDRSMEVAEHEGLTPEAAGKAIAGVRDKVVQAAGLVVRAETAEAPASAKSHTNRIESGGIS